MNFKLDMLSIAEICNTQLIGKNIEIKHFVTDSRNLFSCEDVIFCAIRGISFDGHNYIDELVKRGVKAFIVEDDTYIKQYNVSYILAENSINSLQKIAAYYRGKIEGKVTSIIGSNGKSVIKEWISQLVDIEKSPKSYNSQLGVALSVLGVPTDSKNYVFEAGISQCGEMQRLESIIKPENVIFTNISDAHSENFESKELKLKEKLVMADSCKRIIYNCDNETTNTYISNKFQSKELFCWGEKEGSTLKITKKHTTNGGFYVEFIFKQKTYELTIPFTDTISYYNVMTALSYIAAVHSHCEFEKSIEKCSFLEPVEMRLEIKNGNNGAIIINDTYNSDLKSLAIALDTLNTNCYNKEKIVVLSDIQQSYLNNEQLYENVKNLLLSKNIETIYGVGPEICKAKASFNEIKNAHFFQTTQDLISQTPEDYFDAKAVLLKGSRKFKFEQISDYIEKQVHTTVFEVNLSKLLDNYTHLKSKLKPETKCMAMVKADAYGCGAVEIAKTLEKQGINYFAVAYADEGVKLRKQGIKLPIVVLNSEPHAYRTMIKYRLEPEIYSFKSLKEFSQEVKHLLSSDYPIHIKLDTGMHRLGFTESDLQELISTVKDNKQVKISSIFSHFTSSDNPEHDIHSENQINLYDRMSSKIKNELGLKNVIRHLANSSAIERFSEAEFDMVRMGISLYAKNNENGHIKDIFSLKSTVAQLHSVKNLDTVGYNKNQTLKKDSRIATVPIGYADGFRRMLSCGAWSFEINGKLAPTIGNICMDACMVDVTDVECAEGDEVVIIGKNNTVENMAQRLNTINYEIMTLISPRVKRVYIKE